VLRLVLTPVCCTRRSHSQSADRQRPEKREIAQKPFSPLLYSAGQEQEEDAEQKKLKALKKLR
jgi:hypothetical protein